MSREVIEAEINRLAAKTARYGPDVVWTQNEFSEILPFPKPLSLSLLRRLAAHDGATGAVCRELGLPYNPAVPVEDYLETVFGRTSVNLAAEHQLAVADSSSFLQSLKSAIRVRRERNNYYCRFKETISLFDACDNTLGEVEVPSLKTAELIARIRQIVATLSDHYRHVVKAGLFAKICLDELTTLVGKAEVSPLLAIDGRHLQGSDTTAQQIFAFREKKLADFAGFAADVDYELATPRFLETGQPFPLSRNGTTARPNATALDRKTRAPLLRFKLYESLKIIYKTVLLRELYLLRLSILEYDRRHTAAGDSFYLTLDELLTFNPRSLREEVARRRRDEEIFSLMDVPARIQIHDLQAIGKGVPPVERSPLAGVSVNGTAFSGRAVICRTKADLDRAEGNGILVVRHASPDLVLAFHKVGGIITETGGLLSHLAIVAREQGVPLLLQVPNATLAIREGDYLSVSEAGVVSLRN